MKDRIRKIMEAQDMSQKNFADCLGISQATLSSIFSERTKPTLSIVEAIGEHFPMISLEWIMKGEGSMYKDENKNKVEVEPPKPVAESPRRVANEELSMFESEIPIVSAKHIERKSEKRQDMTAVKTVFSSSRMREVKEIMVFFNDGTYETFESGRL